MHASFSFVLAALAGSALAIPMISNSTTTSHTSVASSSSSSHWRSSNSTTTPPTSQPTTVTWTQTDTITKTSFVPTSTPAATSAGSTYYSTWLTTKVWTTTSCYETSSVKSVYPFTPAPPAPTTTVGSSTPAGNCPAPTATVTIIETVTAAPTGAYYPPGQCETCQTITYTDIWGYVVTIAVPTNPWTPSTSVYTSSASSTASSKTTSTYASSSSSSAPVKGTGSYTPKPTAYPTNIW